MNILKSFFAGLVVAAAAPAVAIIINFDDLTSDQVIQNGYAGLNWTNFDVYDAVNDPDHLSPSGYHDADRGSRAGSHPIMSLSAPM